MQVDAQLLRNQRWSLSLGGEPWLHSLETWAQGSASHFPAVQSWTSPSTLLSLRVIMGKMWQILIPTPLTLGGIQGEHRKEMAL